MKKLYHATSLENLFSILNDKCLVPNAGICIHEKNGQKVCLSDIFSDYLFVIFGDYVIEFKESIFQKNKLVPTSYEYMKNLYPKDYTEMAFEEAEWTADKILFDYEDINKIVVLEENHTFLSLENLLKTKFKITLEFLKRDEVPNYSLDYFFNQYLERINIYA